MLPFVDFTSCSDDDEKNDDPISDIEILGKYYSADYPDEYIELKENGVAIEYDGEGEVTYGTYVYDAPNITISFEDGEGDRYTYSGSISGKTMILDEGVYVKRDGADNNGGNSGDVQGILGKYYSADYPDEYIELKENGTAIDYCDDKGGYMNYGTYVYDAPYITISFEDGEGDRYTYGGTISGNTMRLNEGVYVRR